jgi:hypothetical protein
MRVNVVAWIVFGAIVVLGFARALAARPIASPPPADEHARRAAYVLMVTEEQNMRRDAIKDFPADPWSQDDAFHNLEYRRAKEIARKRGMSVQDVLLAMDEGMRERWPKPVAINQKATVPPCRPRPIH